MRINKHDIEDHFCCKVCEFAYQISNYTAEYQNGINQISASRLNQTIRPQERILSLEFWSIEDISRFTAELLQDKVEIDIGDGYIYDIFYKGSSSPASEYCKGYYGVSYPVLAIQKKPLVRLKLSKLENRIKIKGTYKAPCRFIIKPNKDVSVYKIHTYSIKDLKKNHAILLDGIDQVVTDNGSNCFNRVEGLYRFPILEIGEQIISISSLDADVYLEYYPMYV